MTLLLHNFIKLHKRPKNKNRVRISTIKGKRLENVVAWRPSLEDEIKSITKKYRGVSMTFKEWEDRLRTMAGKRNITLYSGQNFSRYYKDGFTVDEALDDIASD
jgi:hypothetical protein